MISIKKHLDMLGMVVEDRVTGFRGVVTSVGFDLYGCIQAIVNPGLDKDGRIGDQHWFDIGRLKLADGEDGEEPVMTRPDFDFDSADGKKAIAEGHKGSAERPRFMKP
jgi:hypothetical protein